VTAMVLPDWAKSSGDGYGYGDGYGSGSGSGDGYGYGYGSGSGDGDGYGYGYGYGYGSSSGSGAGYGSGDGDGYGYGSGDGSGDGYGLLVAFADLAPKKAVLAFWRSTSEGKPANGGQGEAVYPGMVQEVPGPLRLCSSNALHGSLQPQDWKGERWWLVALFEPVQREGSKIGSLKRQIIMELV